MDASVASMAVESSVSVGEDGHQLVKGTVKVEDVGGTEGTDRVGNNGTDAVGHNTAVQASEGNGHHLSVTSAEKAPGMSEELKDVFNKLIDDQGHLDMRNVTMLIWVNRKRHNIVETIVELLIQNSNERRVFNGIEFYLPQLAHMIIHLDVHLPSSAMEQFALVMCQQSLHVALQLNWILVAALEDYHTEKPDGTPNKKANAVYFQRCAKLLQNVERIIALGAPSATELEELYHTGQLTRHEVESRTIADRKKQAEKVIGSPRRGVAPVAEDPRIRGWLWHKRFYKRGIPHRSRWIRRWFEVEDRVLYCYTGQNAEESNLKRAAVLFQAEVKVCDYKDGKYPFYFEVHSPMGNMRLRTENAEAKEMWISGLTKQAQATPSVAHLNAADGSLAGSVTAGQPLDFPKRIGGSRQLSIEEGVESVEDGDRHRDSERYRASNGLMEAGGQEARERAGINAVANAIARAVTQVEEDKRNKRFRFFSEERQFVSDMTDVCETLRFEEDRSKRKALLDDLLPKLHIPDCAYLPLCRSTEAFQRVLRITPGEAKAFSTKERVPIMVTLETERTWAPGAGSRDAPPLDVASFLHHVFGSHAPQHQDQQRYSSTALRGGEESILDPERLAVGDSKDGEDASTPGHRPSRSGSFRFRSSSKVSRFPNMPPIHLPTNITSVWKDKPTGQDAARARGSKSPFRHNLSSLGSVLQAKASSIRHNVKGLRPNINITKKGSAQQQQQQQASQLGNATSVGEKEEPVPLPDSETGKAKNVGWRDENEGRDEGEVKVPDDHGVATYSGRRYSGERKEEERDESNKSTGMLKRMSSEGAVPVDDAGLDKALETKEDAPSGLEDVSLAEDNGGRPQSLNKNADAEDFQDTKPSKAFGESMASKARRIRQQSPEGSRTGWSLQRLILKSNDDVRQEVFVMQMITFYKEVFEREGLNLWLKPYSIVSTAKTTGLIEVLNQATSMDGLKKSEGYPGTLRKHFLETFGPEEGAEFKAAQRRFCCSLAGYSVVSYMLGIKDRHNGNVMIDSVGHIVHIDFGFVFGIAPGKQFSMERAAFKFTAEYAEMLGGKGADLYEEFVDMFTKGIFAARKYATVTTNMMEIMMFQSEFPCFEYMGEGALRDFKKRLMLGAKDSDVSRRARRMVEHADSHWGTELYDRFQLWSNGIMP